MLRLLPVFCLTACAVYAQSCLPAPVLPVGSVAGAIDNTSCVVSDGTAYTSYRMILPVRGQTKITLNPNPANLNLMLRDGAGAQIASGSSIQRRLEAGNYSIVVNLVPPATGGTFTLLTDFAAEPGMMCTAFPLLGLNATASGVLGSSGCGLPDGTGYEAYTVNTFGAGTLTVGVTSQAFQPLLILRGADGSQLGTDPASVTVPVDGSSQYQIVVATSDNKGAYQVTTSFVPSSSETCLPQTALTAPGTDKNSITEGSCSAIVNAAGDQEYYNYYNFVLPSAGQVDLTAASGDFAATLYLLDSNGNTLAIDTGGGAAGSNFSNAEIRMALPPGTYTLQIFSNLASGGNYQLTYQFAPGAPQACPTGVLTPGTTSSGTLSASSCRTAVGLADIYTVALPAAGMLTLDLNATAFTGQVAIRDAKDNLVVSNQDVQGLGTSHLTASLPAGSYTVVAAAVSGSGGYQLVPAFAAAAIAPCTFAQSLTLNGGFNQVLGPSSCIGPNGQPMDVYQFTLPADSTIAAVMTSSLFDGYLSLTDSAGNVLRSDDNSYGYDDPLIVQFLPAGTYQLTARGASWTAGGQYQVNLVASTGARPPFCGPKGTLSASVSGTLGITSCQYSDGTFADVYQLTLAADTTIDLKLTSSDFDAYLVVVDAKGNLVAQDDDSGGGTDARVQQKLVAGQYFVYAKPFANYYSVGSYTLTLAGQ